MTRTSLLDPVGCHEHPLTERPWPQIGMQIAVAAGSERSPRSREKRPRVGGSHRPPPGRVSARVVRDHASAGLPDRLRSRTNSDSEKRVEGPVHVVSLKGFLTKVLVAGPTSVSTGGRPVSRPVP